MLPSKYGMSRATKKLIPVENAPDLVRDAESRAILSRNDSAYHTRVQEKRKAASQKNEIQSLRNEIEELKQLVASLIKST